MWAMEHPPSRRASPRPVTNEGSVDVGVNAGGGQVGSTVGGTSRQRGVIHADEVGGVQARGVQSSAAAGSLQGDVGGRRSGLSPMSATQVMAGGIAPSYGYFKFTSDRILVTPPLVGRQDILTWKEAIEPQLEMAGLINFARGSVVTPEDLDLHAEFRAVHLMTFMVISRCCSPGVQIALKWCREYLDAGHQAWHFIKSTYQVTNDLFIAQLEGQLTHLRMGDEETATDCCNRARRILATIKMAGSQYSTASYVTHVMQGLSSNYNLLKRLSMAPGTRTTLNEDNLTSYILQDEAMQEAERSQELLAQANFVAPAKQGGRPGQRGQSGGGGSSGWKSTKEVDKKTSTKDSGRGGGSGRRECWICHSLDHLSFECPDRSDSKDDDAKGGRRRSSSRRPRRGGNKPCKEKLSTTSTSAKDIDSSNGGKGRDDKTASCSLVGVVEPTVSLAPEAGEDFQAVAAAVQTNSVVVLLDSGCSHHLMGMKEVFVNLQPSSSIKKVRGFNRALQDVQRRGTVALQGAAGKQVLIPDVLYVPGVQANLLSSGQLKEHGVELLEDGDVMLLISAAGEVNVAHDGGCGPAGDRLEDEVDAGQDARAHVGMDTIRSLAKNEVAIGLDLKSATGADSPCVSCVGGKLARHTFPDQGSDANDVLAVVHIDLCGPFRVAAKDGSLYFLLLKDRQTRFMWVRPVAKKSDVLLEFQKWLVLMERQVQKLVLMLRSDRGGEFLGKQFTDFVDGKGIVYDLTCPYTLQQNGMAEREMRAVVESVRTMLLHMGVQHHWWHLALRQAVWVCNCLERSTLPPRMTPYQLLHGTKPDLSLARVWGLLGAVPCPRAAAWWEAEAEGQVGPSPWRVGGEQGLGAPRHRRQPCGHHVGRGVLRGYVAGGVEVGAGSGRTPTTPPTDTLTATLPLLAEVGEPADEDAEVVRPPNPSPATPAPPLVADVHGLTPMSASGDEGSSGTSPSAPAKGIAGGQRDERHVDVGLKPTSIGEEQVEEQQPTGEQAAVKLTTEQSATRPPEFFIPAAFTTMYNMDDDDDLPYDDTEEDEEFPELDPDMLADPEHRWDISRMTVYGADYNETFTPVGSYVTLRIFLNIVAILNLNLMQLDMKNAFLQSKLDQVLYMSQPDYFNDGTGRVCKLLKSLYGLKQSPLLWYLALNDVLVLVYVDDLLTASSSTEMLKELKELLESAFELREISSVQKYLGLEIATDEEAQERQEEEYWQKVGSLQFAATTTRPDIAFACSKLGSGLTVRSDQHWREVDRCLTYLANTRDTALEFGGGPESLELLGFVDADDAGDKQNRMSTGGYVFVYGGAAVSSSSQRIKCATLSSTESEYVAATEAGKEGPRLRFLLAEFQQLDAGKPTVLRVDNKSAITVAEGMGLTSNLKHMER
ncbi:unnamed protein product [Closterium sp. NIES-54]